MSHPKNCRLLLLAGAVLGLATSSAFAQTTLTTELVVNGLTRPIAAVADPGDIRIFIAEQNQGIINVFDGTNLLLTPFLNIKSKIASGGNEQGLLGLVLHPDFKNNGYFFVNYTASGPNRSVIERYQVSAGNPNIADPTSGALIISYNQPFSNHNGGDMRFGADGYLYIGTGDGGSGGDPQCNAQNNASLLGKMLRLDVDGALPYMIPATNPGGGEIWSKGLRNPWRFSFDALNGNLYIGDVGQNAIEEINVTVPDDSGYNFGWKIMEGNNCFNTGTNCVAPIFGCNDPRYTLPVTTYGHGGGNCSITGGEVYRGCKIPELFGTYFYADYCSANILTFEFVGGIATNPQNRKAELKPAGATLNQITSFGVDGEGEILILDQGGQVYRVIAQSQPALADCDANGKDDLCEIIMDPSLDTNNNNVLDSCEPTCGFSTYGAGASAANSLALVGGGSAQVGMTADFTVSGLTTSPAIFFASLGQGSIPALGGIGLVNPGSLLLFVGEPALGSAATWSAMIPADPFLAGANIFVQAVAIEGANPGGWALSNGVQMTICP